MRQGTTSPGLMCPANGGQRTVCWRSSGTAVRWPPPLPSSTGRVLAAHLQPGSLSPAGEVARIEAASVGMERQSQAHGGKGHVSGSTSSPERGLGQHPKVIFPPVCRPIVHAHRYTEIPCNRLRRQGRWEVREGCEPGHSNSANLGLQIGR